MANYDFSQGVCAALKGCRKSENELMSRTYGIALRAVCRILNKFPSDREDVAQDVVINAYFNLSSLKNPKDYPGWIYRIAHNEATNHIREMSRRREILSRNIAAFMDSEKCDGNPLEALMRKELIEKVDKEVGNLPEELKEVVVLYFKGISMEKISSILGISSATVFKRMYAAAEIIRERTEAYSNSS